MVLSYIVAGGPAKTPVESFLRQLIANDDLVSRKQANYITLYLRKLLDTVSRSYLWDGARPAMSAYNVLVHHCHEAMRLGKVSSVSFVSMNYDLLFEQALESQFGIGFDRIENYCGFQPSWSLVKFHGSVNWWHSYDHVKTGQNTGYMKAEHRLIRAIEAGRIVEGNRIQNARIEVRDKWGDQQGDEPVYFPAMAIPVEGKYQAICPDAHVEEIKNALGRNQWKLLVVGFSAKDKDVLDMLSPHWAGVTRFMVVNGKPQYGEEAITGFRKAGLQRRAMSKDAFEGGFSRFVAEDGGLKSFLS